MSDGYEFYVEGRELLRKGDLLAAEMLRADEGLCVQAMHAVCYDEPCTVSEMDKFILENGYVNGFSDTRPHHEIYLGDPRGTAPEKLKTVIRHPIRKGGES